MAPAAVPYPIRFSHTSLLKVGERIGLLLLAILYCIAVTHVATTATEAQFQGEQRAAQGISISDASGFFLCPTTSAEGLVNSVNAPPASGSKDLTKGFVAAIRANQRAYRTVFTEHNAASRSVLLALWRSAILFPFHVFW